MEQVNLVAHVREEIGKQGMKRLRNENLIPAVVYREGEKNVLLQINKKDFSQIIHTSFGGNVIVSLKIEAAAGKTKAKDVKTVIIKEIQEDSLKNEVLHVDFKEISLTETIKVNVPIAVTGESIGVKRDGGSLEHLLWELEVECLPTNIPEKIEINISNLEMNQSVMVKDLKIASGVKILNDPEQILLTVSPPMAEEKVEEKLEEGPAEPEVIKQKKPEAVEEASDKDKKQEKKQEEKK